MVPLKNANLLLRNAMESGGGLWVILASGHRRLMPSMFYNSTVTCALDSSIFFITPVAVPGCLDSTSRAAAVPPMTAQMDERGMAA
jgi:hypothetical protein